MPFVSKAQQGFLFAKKPEVAKEFAEKTPASAYKSLPEHINKKARMAAMQRQLNKEAVNG
jgi:hypothetical protein